VFEQAATRGGSKRYSAQRAINVKSLETQASEQGVDVDVSFMIAAYMSLVASTYCHAFTTSFRTRPWRDCK
jgi:hypothetical protein